MTILAVCLAAVGLLAGTAIVLGVIGYRRLDRGLLDLEDRVDRAEVMPPQSQLPTPPTSLFDRRPEEI